MSKVKLKVGTLLKSKGYKDPNRYFKAKNSLYRIIAKRGPYYCVRSIISKEHLSTTFSKLELILNFKPIIATKAMKILHNIW